MAHRIVDLYPDELDVVLGERPVLYCALGAVEWHGDHLPLGLDALLAEDFTERLATRCGGVVLPALCLPVTPLPHRYSLGGDTSIVTAVWAEIIRMAVQLEARVLCLVTGHYAQGHMVELQRLAVEAMIQNPSVVVIAATPLEFLGDADLLDHAARWETAQMLALDPARVRWSELPDEPRPEHGVLGESPRQAEKDEGERAIEHALEAWSQWIERLLATGNATELVQWYAGQLSQYTDYIDRYYRTSWEQAIQDWWADVRRNEDPGT